MANPRRVRTWSTMAMLAVLSLAPSSTAGQDKRTYYTVLHPDQFTIDWAAFYDRAEAMTDHTRRLVPHHLGLSYGTNPKQRLDVYEATPRGDGAPVFIFLHGGGGQPTSRARRSSSTRWSGREPTRA